MQRSLAIAALVASFIAALGAPASADSPVTFTQIYLDGALVRTLLPPSATPYEGRDPFYVVPGTGGVAAVGPGDRGYHGGQWEVYVVSWNVAQYPLTSVAAILAAQARGDIAITRAPEKDFLCPIQP